MLVSFKEWKTFLIVDDEHISYSLFVDGQSVACLHYQKEANSVTYSLSAQVGDKVYHQHPLLATSLCDAMKEVESLVAEPHTDLSTLCKA